MEKIFEKEVLLKALFPALVVVAMAFTMVVIAYGVESVAPGVHDAFHDFRHVIGMPCH
ncbi:MAG: CbtB-domain containing protein [Deltaproteobacteria bacterium]|nr:CbtB-domain containing protein [Deltaproteobacteria bacterium]MBI5238451.1 CbtB-domain containing protein [Deltaproteobacteria bacterium]